MRVDFVITELFVGGAERCLTELASGLVRHGDFVRVFSLASLPHQGPQRALVDRLENEGIPIESGGADHPFRYAKARRKLARWLSQSSPDILQTFLFHANVLGAHVASHLQIPNCVGGLRVAEKRAVRCWLEKRAVAKMSSLVCVSQAVREFASDRLGCHTAKSVVIGNGVDVQRFANAKPMPWSEIGWPLDSQVTLFVGRLHKQKGLELLTENIDRVAPANTRRRLLIVGQGPLESELQNWCQQIGDDRVKLLPWQSDVAPLMKSARVLVLPSRYEGMPNVVMEAMACGKPVVCSKVEGSKELLAHDDGTQGFESGNGGQMCEAIDRFHIDDSLQHRVGTANEVQMRNVFSLSAMVQKYRNHYETLMQD